MPKIDKITVDNTEYDIVSGDNLPVGTEIDYDGNTVPAGWQEIDDPSVYSTTEQRIGTWIDGKPLYSITNEATITTGDNKIVDISMDIIIKKAEAWLNRTGTERWSNLVSFYSNSNDYCNFYAYTNESTSKHELRVGSAYSGTLIYTIYYTKTTD